MVRKRKYCKRVKSGKTGKICKKHKGRRGRPKGSKNKSTLCTESQGHTSYKSGFELPPDYKEPKSVKFLGYCKCGFTISVTDLISKRIYICPSCSKRCSIGKLDQERAGAEERPKTKKEYLNQTINVKYNDYYTPSAADDIDDEVEEIEEVEETNDKEVKEDKDDKNEVTKETKEANGDTDKKRKNRIGRKK